MKKLWVMALALFFMTATSGLVLADTAPGTSPAVKTASGKTSHKGRHSNKKVKKTKVGKTVTPTK